MIQAKWTTDINSDVYEDALKIRHQVFVDEQKFPKDVEIDEFENQCEYVVLYKENQPIATGRIFQDANKMCHLQRIAVLKDNRKTGLGARLLHELEQQCKNLQAETITLGAQKYIIDFYKKSGYQKVGEEFLEHSVLHQQMKKKL